MAKETTTKSKPPPTPNIKCSHHAYYVGTKGVRLIPEKEFLSQRLASSQKGASYNADGGAFNVRFAFQGHLDVVRSVIFTGGSSPLGPEICTSGDDGVVKRWIIPAATNAYSAHGPSSSITQRSHTGAVLSLAAMPASQNFSNGAKALGDGWVYSGGQDATVRVWEKDRVDPNSTLDGHTDAVWTVCVLSGFSASILGDQSFHHGGAGWMLLASGALDGKILIWAVSTPPQLASSPTGSRRGAGVIIWVNFFIVSSAWYGNVKAFPSFVGSSNRAPRASVTYLY